MIVNKKAIYASVLSIAAAMATAENVTLTSPDGRISIVGELLSSDDGEYRIRSALGEMNLDAFLVQCVGDDCPVIATSERLRITGSTNLTSTLMPELIEGFSEHNGVEASSVDVGKEKLIELGTPPSLSLGTIGLRASANADSFAALEAQQADLVISLRAMESDEAGISGSNQETVIALDGLVFITGSDNPVRSITMDQIAGIYAGRIRNWRDIGGRDAPIQVYTPARTQELREVFADMVMRPRGLEIMADAVQFENLSSISQAFEMNSNGIGFTTFTERNNAKLLAVRGTCGIQTPADQFTIKTEEYPLTTRVRAYRSPQLGSELGGRVLDYLQSNHAQNIVERGKYVSLEVSSQPVSEQGLRFMSSVLPADAETTMPQLQNMVRELIAADRLSLTFRFEQGSANLDERADADITRLIDMLESESFANKEILLVGFTDSIGRADLNVVLSKARAEQVRGAIRRAAPRETFDGVQMTAIGYGEMSPLGCNETAVGRRVNRRVEIWTRDIVSN